MVLFDEQPKLSLMELKLSIYVLNIGILLKQQQKKPLYIQGRCPSLLSITVTGSMTTRSLEEERIYLTYKSIIEKS